MSMAKWLSLCVLEHVAQLSAVAIATTQQLLRASARSLESSAFWVYHAQGLMKPGIVGLTHAQHHWRSSFLS